MATIQAETKAVLRLAQPPIRRFLPAVLLGILASGSAVALLATSAWLITKAAEQPPILFLGFAIVGVRAFALGRAFFRYVERLVSHNAAFRSLSALRTGIYRRLVPLAPDGLRGTRRGDLLSRLVGDVDQLQDLPLRVVQPLTTSIVVALASVIGVWIVLPEAAVALLLCLLLAAILGTLVQRVIAARAERSIAPLRAELSDLLLDYTSRLDVLTAFGARQQAEQRIDTADAQLRTALLRRSLGSGVVTAGVTALAGLATLLALVLGGPALDAGRIDGPRLALLALVPMAVFEVFGMVPLAMGAWRQVAVSAGRIAEIVPVERPAEIPADPSAPMEAPVSPFPLLLDDVSARWPGAARPALTGVSLRLDPGDRVLVVGESGSGKTTLAHVLVRFLAHQGSYSLGGVDVTQLRPDDVRRFVGLCEQSPHLFAESIRQNLLFAKDDATEQELLDVLASVGLASWVEERGGIDSPVGERGALVSGGQAQRIALARALLAGFPILVLDEPTANVDADRADALLRELLDSAASAGRAIVLISHTPVASELITSTLRLG